MTANETSRRKLTKLARSVQDPRRLASEIEDVHRALSRTDQFLGAYIDGKARTYTTASDSDEALAAALDLLLRMQDLSARLAELRHVLDNASPA